MERTKHKQNGQGTLSTQQRVISETLSRMAFGRRLGWSYGDDRKLFDALGYPDEKTLTFEYYYNKYDRNEIAAAVIDRPADATWDGDLMLLEEGSTLENSKLGEAWRKLDARLKVKQRLCKVDKLAGIGRYSILLFGFKDVSKSEDWATPIIGKKNLLYIKQIAESEITIDEWEMDTSNERFGMPKFYKLTTGTPGQEAQVKEIKVHHSRTLHILQGNLTSEIYGTSRLKVIINRLLDLEKILGGDAEMFWRGARPGYHADAKDDYEMGATEQDALAEELDKYEHDLRRFLSTKGVDITALESQVADPTSHVDVQLQAISAKTGIPKRVLVGTERGELASSQDRDAWLTLIQTRMNDFAEPDIFRPFINKCMEHGVLPLEENYDVMWDDVFSPSEAEKVRIGKDRSDALKVYADSPFASEILSPKLAYKYLLGLDDVQVEEVIQVVGEEDIIEERMIRTRPPEPVPNIEPEE